MSYRLSYRFDIAILILVATLYTVNSYIIKPLLPANDTDVLTFFLNNYHNDLWAGTFICAFLNIISLLLLKKKVQNFAAYFALFVFCSVTWELLRPYILLVFNPLHKIPHALWGDVAAYGAGFIIYGIAAKLTSRHCSNK